MKFLERVALVIYSYLILIISVVMCLLIFGWIDCDFIGGFVEKALTIEWISNTILVLSIIFILLSLYCIFFDSSAKEKSKDRQGILLENENGKLIISKDTIESLVITVSKSFESIKEIDARVFFDKENNVMISITLTVNVNAIIKELSSNLQAKIKETIKNTTDLEVKEVNIKVRNFAPKKETE